MVGSQWSAAMRCKPMRSAPVHLAFSHISIHTQAYLCHLAKIHTQSAPAPQSGSPASLHREPVGCQVPALQRPHRALRPLHCVGTRIFYDLGTHAVLQCVEHSASHIPHLHARLCPQRLPRAHWQHLCSLHAQQPCCVVCHKGAHLLHLRGAVEDVDLVDDEDHLLTPLLDVLEEANLGGWSVQRWSHTHTCSVDGWNLCIAMLAVNSTMLTHRLEQPLTSTHTLTRTTSTPRCR